MRPVSHYLLFQPWSPMVRKDDKAFYWISYIAISLLSGFIVPLAYCLVTAIMERNRPPLQLAKMSPNDKEGEKIYKILKKEIKITEPIDTDPTNHLWLKSEREEQSLSQYKQTWAKSSDYKPLRFKLVGNFSHRDMEIIELVIEFIKVFHRIEVSIDPKIERIEELNTPWRLKKNWENRKVRQYFSTFITRKAGIQDGDYCLVITDQYITPNENYSYVFGEAHHEGPGIISNYLFGRPENNFRKVLERMIKITAHEFCHVYGLKHCSLHECNIGGYMNRPELDKRPYFNCSIDTAKICLKKRITMKQYYTDLLDYFLRFKEKYATDFYDYEIKHVSLKLNQLTKHPEIYS